MKICDLCKRNNLEIGDSGPVNSIVFGVISGYRLPGDLTELSIECEVCCECLSKLIGSVASHLEATFGVKIPR